MGSYKNKRNHHNNHRHVFRQRWHAKKYQKQACTHESVRIEGSRIVNIEKLQEYVNNLTINAAQCGGDVFLEGENRDGLAAIILSRCPKCNYTILLETSRKVKGPRGYC